jgi:hypothetical protein
MFMTILTVSNCLDIKNRALGKSYGIRAFKKGSSSYLLLTECVFSLTQFWQSPDLGKVEVDSGLHEARF